MKNLITVIAMSFALISTSFANDAASQIVRAHLKSLFTGNTEAMAQSYADKVTLMPGHEFLKPEYGFSNSDDRSTAVEVDRQELIAEIKKVSAKKPAPPDDKVAEKLEALRFIELETKPGDFATQASDPVKTTDGKLHFSVVEGDIIYKVAPPKGDFLIVQLRKSGDKWQIISEYLD